MLEVPLSDSFESNFIFITMRRFCFAAFLLCFVGQLSAQGLFDALRFSDNSINGTARYMSMAGAFGALGGDPTSIMDNPAGLAIYRGDRKSVV